MTQDEMVERQMLDLAAKGCPYLLIVQKDCKRGTKVYTRVIAGFDMDNLFRWIREYAQREPEFKKALADYVIDLSKNI